MMVDIACPACAAAYKVPDTILGKNLKCKACQTPFVAKTAAPAPAVSDLPAPSPAEAGKPPPSGRARAVAVVVLGVGVLAVVGGLAVGAYYWLRSSSGPEWQEFASKEGGFFVMVPTAPAQSKAADAKMGVELREFVAKPPKSAITFTVGYADLPDKPINDYLYLSWLKHNTVTSTPNAKLAEEQEVTQGGHTGRQFALDLPDEQRLTRRMYLVENRVYLVSAQHPRATATDVDKFFDSFKITSAPPAVKPKPTEAVTPPPPTQVVVLPQPTMPATKVVPLPEPPPATGKMPPDKGKNPPPVPADFPISPDERSVVEEINRVRAAEPVPALKPNKTLFDRARAEAAALARKQNPKLADAGYRNYFRFTVPAVGMVTAQLLIDNLAGDKRSKRELVDSEFTEIGVAIGKGPGNLSYFVIILAGNPR
jgi:uncharacterized protein YkwD